MSFAWDDEGLYPREYDGDWGLGLEAKVVSEERDWKDLPTAIDPPLRDDDPPRDVTVSPVLRELLNAASGKLGETPYRQLKQIDSHLTKHCANAKLAQWMVQNRREYTVEELRDQWELEASKGGRGVVVTTAEREGDAIVWTVEDSDLVLKSGTSLQATVRGATYKVRESGGGRLVTTGDVIPVLPTTLHFKEYLHVTHLYKCRGVPDVTPDPSGGPTKVQKKGDMVCLKETGEHGVVTVWPGDPLIEVRKKNGSTVRVAQEDAIVLYKSVAHGTAMPMCYVTVWEGARPMKLRLCDLYYDACDPERAPHLPKWISEWYARSSFFSRDGEDAEGRKKRKKQ